MKKAKPQSLGEINSEIGRIAEFLSEHLQPHIIYNKQINPSVHIAIEGLKHAAQNLELAAGTESVITGTAIFLQGNGKKVDKNLAESLARTKTAPFVNAAAATARIALTALQDIHQRLDSIKVLKVFSEEGTHMRTEEVIASQLLCHPREYLIPLSKEEREKGVPLATLFSQAINALSLACTDLNTHAKPSRRVN